MGVSLYGANDALGPLWKATVAAALGAREAKLLSACKKMWPDSDRDRIRAVICARLDDGSEGALVDELHAMARDKVDGLGPRLPSHRREVLLAEAAATAETWRVTLCDMRVVMRGHTSGGPLLYALGRHITAASEAGSASPALTRQASADGKQRGESHERAALDWARARWPDHEVWPNACLVADESGAPPAHGLKAEFDALVVATDERAGGGAVGWLDALVEAKAGSDVFGDVHKLLAARTALMGASATLTVRAGRMRNAPTKLARDFTAHTFNYHIELFM